MASCSTDWQESSFKIGDIIHAVFTWTDAIENPEGSGTYGGYTIVDPDGNSRIMEYVNEPTGTITVEVTADMEGMWLAYMSIWDGTKYVQCQSILMNITTQIYQYIPYIFIGTGASFLLSGLFSTEK